MARDPHVLVQFPTIESAAQARERAQRGKRAQQFAQATIDALSSSVCVLNEKGVIVAVNQAWNDFAQANRKSGSGESRNGLGVGADYLAVCDRAVGPGAVEGARFAAGIRDILSGGRKRYSMEYTCDAPGERGWFIGRVTRFAIDGGVRLVIEHNNISELKLAEESLGAAREAAQAAADHHLFQHSLLRAINNASLNGILAVNDQGRVMSHNQKLPEVWGIPEGPSRPRTLSVQTRSVQTMNRFWPPASSA